jgi:hypothetical protein
MSTYVVTAADSALIANVKHDFYSGFTVESENATHDGLNLSEMRSVIKGLCKEAGVEEITVEDLDPKYGSKTSGPVSDTLSVIRY